MWYSRGMRLSLRGVLVVVGASLAGACASPYVAVPLNVHPSAATTGPSVGASGGGVYGHAEDSNIVSLPYSEAWLRMQAGTGQFGVHLGPGVGSVGYRFDLQPMTDGMGFAIEPFGGGGYYRISEPDLGDGTGSTSAYTLILAGGLRVHLLFPTGDGFFYISPVLGVTHLETDENDLDNVNDVITIGSAFGMNLGGRPGTSIELSIHRLSPSDDFDTDLWIVGPSVGFQL
jgi:hypothetical protein